MKITLYFAVNSCNDYIYMAEKPMADTPENASTILDLIDDRTDLKMELNWDQLDKEHLPDLVGCYQAVVEYRYISEDEYEFDVVHCIPVCVL